MRARVCNSFCRLSSVACASVKPDSSDLSTRTLNHDSILLPKNRTDTTYTSVPGTIAIKANITTSRTVSRVPNTCAR